MSGLTLVEKRLALPHDVAMRGSGRLQLFDDLTGRAVVDEKFTNFVAVPLTNYMKWSQRNAVLANFGANASFPIRNDRQPMHPASAVYLTDSALAESPSTERLVPGNVRGFAMTFPHSLTYGGFRGNPNTTESTMSATTQKYVFDWATNQANGTFQSVCWGASRTHSYVAWYTTETFWWHPEPPISWEHYAATDYAGNGIPGDTERLIGFDVSTDEPISIPTAGGTSVKRWTNVFTDLSRFSNVAAAPAPTSTAVMTADVSLYDAAMSMTVNKMWATATATPFALKRYTLGTAAAELTWARPWTEAQPGFITYDGTYIYCCRNGTDIAVPTAVDQDPAATVTIYKVRESDGVTVASWNHPRRVWGLYWDPPSQVLFVFESVGAGVESSSTGTTTSGGKGRMIGYSTSTGSLVIGATLLTDPQRSTNGASAFIPVAPALDLAYSPTTAMVLGNWYYNIQSGTTTRGTRLIRLENLGARSLLGSPVTKSSLQTMKLTYQFDYV